MEEDTLARFDAGARAWADYNRTPLGRIRREVTWHNLARRLPVITDPEQPPRVLDAGGGSGELALRLARQGYAVWLLDPAPAMLDQARAEARALPGEIRARLTLRLGKAEEAAEVYPPRFFAAIACHTLIEYLPEPHPMLEALAGLLCEGGLLSVSFVNRHAEVLRQVWSKGDPDGALAALEQAPFCAGLFGVSGMAYTAEEVSAWLGDLGLAVTATCGVRALADYLPRQRLEDPVFFDALLRLEKAVANCPPYCLIARYVHLMAHKPVEKS